MNTSTQRFLSLGLSLVLIIAAFIVYVSFLKPAYQNFENTKADAISRSDFVKNQQAAVAQIQNLISSYKSQTDTESVVSRALPSSPDLSSAISQISGLAANNNLTLNSINASLQPFQSAPNENYTNLPAGASAPVNLVKPIGAINLQVQMSGSYENFKNFIQQAETDIRILAIKDLRINANPQAPQSDLYDYNLTVVAYYQSK